jgi:hypothetical protein
MFDQRSRHFALETARLTTPDGRTIAYKRRRFLPQGRDLLLLAEAALAPGDRLDLISARLLGDAEQFWRICDANDAMDPNELESPTGRRLRVPVPEA